MKKILIILGIILLVGVVYMSVKLSGIIRDDTTYDLSSQVVIDEGEKAETPIDPSNEEIISRIFPGDKFKRISDVEFAPIADEGIVTNTYIVQKIVRGDIDNDLYTDAFVIAEVTGAAGIANTAYLVTRTDVIEGFSGTVLTGRIIYEDGGFTPNKQLFVVFVQAVTGEKERILYDYSVVNGVVTLNKVSSKITPPEGPSAS